MANGSKKTSRAGNNPSEAMTPEQLVSEIRRRAQEIFEKRGSAPGTHLDDWLKAEKEVKSKHGIAQ